MAHEIGTVTVKMTDTELQHAITSLEFYTTLNIPIDTEYLVPYDKLTVITGKIQQKKCKPCD